MSLAELQYQKHFLVIDSIDRNRSSYPTASTYTMPLPTVYRNIVSARLVSAEIPLSFYQFSASIGNTSVTINSTTVTIPDGNYTGTTLASALGSVITAVIASATVAFSASTQKITITSTGSFTLTATASNLGRYLGFEAGVFSSAPNNITSQRVVITQPYKYILLDIEGLNNMDECGRDGIHSAFSKIPVKGGSDGTIFLNENDCITNTSLARLPIGRLDRLQVKWRFHDGQLVDFNNVEHALTLEIVCIENQLNNLSTIPTPMREK